MNEIRLKYLVSDRITTGASESASDYNPKETRYIRISDFDENGNIRENSKVSIPNTKAENFLLKKNDILIAVTGATVGKSMIFGLSEKAAYAGYLALIRTNDRLNYKYLYYYLNSPLFDKWRKESINVSTIENISASKYANLPIYYYDVKKQIEIVSILDTISLQIDKLIYNQQQQIEKLKEYKQSLISEVVTKGLDPNVEFKDSGIEIIDKIPKDWGIIKMKYLGESRNGLTYNPSDMVDDGEGILVLRSSNVRDGKLIFDDNVYLKMQIKEDLMLKNGDILICSRNGSRDLIGKNAIIENVGLCSFGAFMMVFRVSKTNPKYIKYILDSFIFNYYLGTYLTATINQLTLSNFKNMKVIYTTNSDEQEKIISYLDEKCQKIDQLIELKAKKLLNLEEFKKSLIYEYVTGKKEVS